MFAAFGGNCCCCANAEEEIFTLISASPNHDFPKKDVSVANSSIQPSECSYNLGEGDCDRTQQRSCVEADDEIEENTDDGHFIMDVQLHANERFGVDVCLSPSMFVQVVSITSGAANDWNHGRSRGQQCLQEGDQIVEVNGICDPHVMLTRLSELSLRIVVKPRKEFGVVIVKGGERLGIEVNMKQKRRSLIVSKIVAGPVVRWNEENSARQLNVKDHIVEINGFRGDGAELLQRLKLAETLQMSIVSFQ
eukprot:TRINITY_DN77394_c0_g1_i1.p1 TRINITY_DN77394_c0_g1~~TRINITY_DN77394_c0_g1_i1.p1  ORF type:complete len:280 (+),score=43.86 TRINITY_DN77394_c0_g1_i1:93-842(+)